MALCSFEKIHSFRYHDLTAHDKPNAEVLNFPDFLNILQLVAPDLKHATVLRRRIYDSHVCLYNRLAFIRFNNFKYYLPLIDGNNLKEVMKIFLSRTKSLETLNISITQLMIDDWALFFQANNKIETLKYSDDQFVGKRYFIRLVSCFPSELKRVQLHTFLKFDYEVEDSIVQVPLHNFYQISCF